MGQTTFSIGRNEPINIRIRIYSLDGKDSRILSAVLDTGATRTYIPAQILLELDYDLSKAREIDTYTVSGTEKSLIVIASKLTAIQETIEQIEVICSKPEVDIPEHMKRIALLGMSFLSQFDNLNISFSKGILSLT